MANKSTSGWVVPEDTSGWAVLEEESEVSTVKTMNRYVKLMDENDGDWCESNGRGGDTGNESENKSEFQTQRRERKKRSTGSVDSHTFSAMSTL